MQESEATNVIESSPNQIEITPFTEAEVSDFSDPAGLIDLAEYVHSVPEPTTTVALTNSPGCTPAGRAEDADAGRSQATRTRHMRKVRVDAWAAPASASWGRPRAAVRKVSSQRMRATARATSRATSRASSTPSTDWALPF